MEIRFGRSRMFILMFLLLFSRIKGDHVYPPHVAVIMGELVQSYEGLHSVVLLNQMERDSLASSTVSDLHEQGKDTRIMSCNLEDVEQMLKPSEMALQQQHLIVSFCHQEQLLRMLLQIKQENLENPLVTWVSLVEAKDDQRAKLIVSVESVVREGTQLLLLLQSKRGTVLYQSKAISSDKPRLFKIQSWESPKSNKFEMFQKVPFQSLYPNLKNLETIKLNGRTLRISVVDNWPFFGLKEDGSKILPDSGIDVSVVKALSKVMNFEYEIVSPSDGQWGGPAEGGNVTGMIGQVARGEAHLAIDEITITGARETVVDFSIPYYLESSTVLSKAPAPSSKAFAVFSPFTFLVWIVLVCAIIAVGPFMTFISVFERKQYSERQKNIRSNVRGQFSSLVISPFLFTFNSFRSFMIQDNREKPEGSALRCLFVFWYLFGYIIYALYAGTLTAVLAAPSYERAIDSLVDLLESIKEDNVMPVVTEGSSIHELFESAKSGLYSDIRRRFDGDKSLVYSIDDGVETVMLRKSALVEATLACEIRATIRGRHLFHLSRQSFYPQAYGIACIRGSPYKYAIDALLLRLVEAGLINKWKGDEVLKVASRRSTDGETSSAVQVEEEGAGVLTLTHLQGAFFVYFIGIALSICGFLVEKCCQKLS